MLSCTRKTKRNLVYAHVYQEMESTLYACMEHSTGTDICLSLSLSPLEGLVRHNCCGLNTSDAWLTGNNFTAYISCEWSGDKMWASVITDMDVIGQNAKPAIAKPVIGI